MGACGVCHVQNILLRNLWEIWDGVIFMGRSGHVKARLLASGLDIKEVLFGRGEGQPQCLLIYIQSVSWMGSYTPTGIYWDSRLIKSSIQRGEQRRTPRETICVGSAMLDLLTSRRVTQPPDGSPAAWRKEQVAIAPSLNPKLACGAFLKSPPAFRNAKWPRFPIFNPFTASWRCLLDLIPLDSWWPTLGQTQTVAQAFRENKRQSSWNTQLWAHSVKIVLKKKKTNNEKTSEVLRSLLIIASILVWFLSAGHKLNLLLWYWFCYLTGSWLKRYIWGNSNSLQHINHVLRPDFV